MRDLIKSVPIPTAGLALGLAALGNLLQPYTEIAHLVCGALSCLFLLLLIAKALLFPQLIREDLKNSIFASVSATFFMTLMNLAGYLSPVAHTLAFMLWAGAIVGHFLLMIWFTVRFIAHFKLQEVFPTYFICYVGIIVASVTAPSFGAQHIGIALFWFGFVCYAVLLVVVTLRCFRHEILESARPLLCIYSAPMSLSLAGYLASCEAPSAPFVIVLLVLAQALFLFVLAQMPKLIRLKFYPSFAAMTFPFVITATAFGKAVAYLRELGLAQIAALDIVAVVEVAFACVMVVFVTCHYLRFFVRQHKMAASVA